jgi:hypothetical protein
MEKVDLTMVYQIEQEERLFAPRRSDHVPEWMVILGKEILVTRWTGPLRHQKRPWPDTRPGACVCHPPI